MSMIDRQVESGTALKLAGGCLGFCGQYGRCNKYIHIPEITMSAESHIGEYHIEHLGYM